MRLMSLDEALEGFRSPREALIYDTFREWLVKQPDDRINDPVMGKEEGGWRCLTCPLASYLNDVCGGGWWVSSKNARDVSGNPDIEWFSIIRRIDLFPEWMLRVRQVADLHTVHMYRDIKSTLRERGFSV